MFETRVWPRANAFTQNVKKRKMLTWWNRQDASVDNVTRSLLILRNRVRYPFRFSYVSEIQDNQLAGSHKQKHHDSFSASLLFVRLIKEKLWDTCHFWKERWLLIVHTSGTFSLQLCIKKNIRSPSDKFKFMPHIQNHLFICRLVSGASLRRDKTIWHQVTTWWIATKFSGALHYFGKDFVLFVF